jgi:pimeloyl-ACP methyl ester carboxylesterase
MPRSTAKNVRRPSSRVALIAALLAAACADDVGLPTIARAPSDQPTARVALRDAEIDRNDTHFAARIAISADDPVTAGLDASLVAGDASVQGAPPPGDAYVEGGYGTNGELRFGVYWDQSSAATVIAGIRVVGDQLSVLDQSGNVTLTRTFDAHMAATGFPGGSLIGAILTTSPPDNGCSAPNGWCAMLRADGESSARDPRDPRDPRGTSRSSTITGDRREDRVRLRPAPTRVALAGAGDFSDIIQRYRRLPTAAKKGIEVAAASIWRLEEIEREVRATTDRGVQVTRSRTRVDYRVWHTNASRDDARTAVRDKAREARRAAPRPPSPARPAVPATPLGAPDAELAAVLAESDAVTLGESICPRGTTEILERTKNYRWAPALLYQHGFCGNARVFDGMRPRIAASIPARETRAFSLSSTERVDTQVDQLAERLAFVGSGGQFAVGHSQGGLVLRRLGQRFPNYVNGVVTIGTPHQGTYVADFAPEAVSEWMLQAVGPACVGDFMCQFLNEVITQTLAAKLGYGLLSVAVPALADLRTGSPFLQTLNSTPEGFQRTGIEVSVARRWALARMIGDHRTPRTRLLSNGRPYGESWAKTAEAVYRTGMFLQYLAFFSEWQVSPSGGGVSCSQTGYALHWAPCFDLDYGSFWYSSWYDSYIRYVIYLLGSIVTTTMDRLDATWDYITTRGWDGTDGFIQLSSQRYPQSPGTFAPVRVIVSAPEADSHAGITASPAILNRTVDALRQMTGVAR